MKHTLPDLSLDHLKELSNHAMRFYNQGLFQPAKETFEALYQALQALIDQGQVELRPKLAMTQMGLGNCLNELGDLPAARQTYEACLLEYQALIDQGQVELRPDLAMSYVNLGSCLSDLGDLSAARQVYETSLTEYQALIDQGCVELRPNLAHTYMNLGTCLNELGDLPAARQAYEASLLEYRVLIDQGQAELGPDLTRARMNLGTCLWQQGNLPAARQAYEVSLLEYQTLIDQGQAELRPNWAINCMNLGVCLWQQGDLPAARQKYEASLLEYQALIDQGHAELRPNLAMNGLNLGECLRQLGDLPAAYRTLKASLLEYQVLIDQGRAELRLNLARTRMNLGTCLSELGDLHAAHQAYETCLLEFQTLIDQGRAELRPALAFTRMHLGNCLLQLGDLLAASQAYGTSLSEYQTLINQGRVELRPDLAHVCMNLGICFSDLGDLLTARRMYETSLLEYHTLIDQGRVDLRPDLAMNRMNLGNCLWQLGDLPAAGQRLEDSLLEYQALIDQGRADLRPDLAKVRMNLGTCLWQQGDLLAAHQTLENSLLEYQTLIDQGRAELRPDLARTQMNLGLCLRQQGDLPAAWRAHQDSLTEYQALIDQGRAELRPDLARTQMNLGLCLSDLQDWPQADQTYQQSLVLFRTLRSENLLFPDTIKMMRDIANWYTSPQRPTGPDISQAFEITQTGLDWLDTLLSRVSDAAKSLLVTQNIALYGLATDLALQLKLPQQAYIILERSKTRVLVEQMLRQQLQPETANVPPALQTRYRELRDQLRQLTAQLDSSSTPAGREETTRPVSPVSRQTALQQQLQRTEYELTQVQTQIAQQDPAFGELLQPRPLTAVQLTELLAPDELLIAFEQRPTFLRLYAITQHTVQTTEVPLSAAQVEEQWKKFKQGINSQAPRLGLDTLCPWLDTHLATPFTQFFHDHHPQQLTLIPHQTWHLFPLHLLTIEGRYLAEHYPLRYLPSLQVLRLIQERTHPAQQGPGCIIANPRGDLSGAEAESQTVHKLRGQQDTFLLHEEATLATVSPLLNQAQHSHFSCHGYYAPDLQAGLMLADGNLTAKDLFSKIRLDNPQLVVMSACETAQLQPTLADEYMGLTSSFLYAGAHTVLATQWRVNDFSSQLLIEDFYQGIIRGLPPILALQQAQEKLKQMPRDEAEKRLQQKVMGPKTVPPYEHPYYWAGFVVIGEG